jgi:hypothetical protein
MSAQFVEMLFLLILIEYIKVMPGDDVLRYTNLLYL